jgi:hypothetical protein
MSNIHRTLVLNPVEPAPFSMKLRTGLEHQIEVEYLRQNGAPYNTDFGAQLYLIERTTGAVRSYLLPATDVINGKARAFIPAGDIRDKNGYNLQIIGSVEGEPRLVARGSASVYETEALGIIPADLIDQIDITLAYNEDTSLDVNLWRDINKTLEYGIAGSSITANIWDKMGGAVLAPFKVAVLDNNTVRLTMSAGTINTLPAQCWWSISITSGAGLTTLAQGNVLITGVPHMVFTEIDLPFVYAKPATLTDPISGQCIHCTNALDLLRFSIYDADGTDRTDWLSQMKPGSMIILLTPITAEDVPTPPDPITLALPRDDPEPPPTPLPAGTAWTITSAVQESGYFQFGIDPPNLSPEIGNQDFRFIK